MRHIGNCPAEDAGETHGQGQRESGEVLSAKRSQQAQIRSEANLNWGYIKDLLRQSRVQFKS